MCSSDLSRSEESDIVFTGLRPGEKLAEELAHAAEDLRPSRYDGIRIANTHSLNYEILRPRLERIERAAWERRTPETVAALSELVPDYKGASAAGSVRRTAS